MWMDVRRMQWILCVMYACMYLQTDRQEKQAGVKRAKVVQRVAQVELDERASER